MDAQATRLAIFPLAAPRLPVSALAALALTAAAMLWGTSFVAAKVVLSELPPVTVALLRFAVAAAVLLPLAYRGGGRPMFGAQSALLGLTGISLYYLCQNAGLRATSAAHAMLILVGALPVLTALFAAGFLGERPSRRLVGGLAFSLLGVIAVASADGVEPAGASLWGDGLLLLAAVSGAGYTVLGRRAFAAADPLAVLAGSTVWGALLLVPPAALETVQTGLAGPSPQGLLLLLYLGLGCSALAFSLWAFSLRHLTAAQTAVLCLLELPIGLVTAAMVLGEVPDLPQVMGSVLLVIGAACAMETGSGERRSPSVSQTGASKGNTSAPWPCQSERSK